MGIRNQVVLEIYENFGTSFISLGVFGMFKCIYEMYRRKNGLKLSKKVANIHGVLSVCRVLFHVLCGY